MLISIYKITNIINDKKYVGITKRPVHIRFNEHCRPFYSKKSRLTRAILKYGRENFRIEILETVDSIDRAVEREQALIKDFNCLDGNGYNSHKGGCFARSYVNYNIRPSDLCLRKAREARTGAKASIETRLRMSKSASVPKPHKRKPIIAIDLASGMPQFFESTVEASVALGIPASTISNDLNGHAPSRRFSFVFEKDLNCA